MVLEPSLFNICVFYIIYLGYYTYLIMYFRLEEQQKKTQQMLLELKQEMIKSFGESPLSISYYE